MRIGLITLILVFTGCFQTENSSSQDDAYADDSSLTPEFQAARAVFAQSCNGCHTYHTMSEAQLVAQGVLVPGDPEGSRIYGRLQNSTGSIAPKDMPQSASISAGDLEIIKTWVQGAVVN